MWQQSAFFFIPPEDYDNEIIKKILKNNVLYLVSDIKEILENLNPFSSANFQYVIHNFVAEKQANSGSVMSFLRLALVGGLFGPDLPVIVELLGKGEVLKRIENLLDKIKLFKGNTIV